MDTVPFVLHIRGLKPLLVFYFGVEEKFAGGKFREIPFAVDIIFAGGKFRAKSKFAKKFTPRGKLVLYVFDISFRHCLTCFFLAISIIIPINKLFV